MKGVFEGVDEGLRKHFGKDHPRRVEFIFSDAEVALVVGNLFDSATQEIRQYLGIVLIVFGRPVEK